MTNIECHLVGFSHHAWQGEGLKSRLDKAPGKRVVLMPDPENLYNPEAVMAYIDTFQVAYVSDSQCHAIRYYCNRTSDGLLYGQVTASMPWEQTLCVEVSVPDCAAVIPPVNDDSFDKWATTYADLPCMVPTAEEYRLCMLAADIRHLLTQEVTDISQLTSDLDVFLALTSTDPSREMTADRHKLLDLLKHSADTKLNDYAMKLEDIITRMGSDNEKRVLARRVETMAQSAELIEVAKRYDNKVRVEEALEAFPYGLYREYQIDKGNCLKMMYYRRAPRKVIRKFVTLVALLDYVGRATDRPDAAHRLQQALNYVHLIDNFMDEQWKALSADKWRQILEAHPSDLADTGKQKFTDFNKKFVCSIIGELKYLGIYGSKTEVSELTMKLEGNAKAGQRNYIYNRLEKGALREEVDGLWK